MEKIIIFGISKVSQVIFTSIRDDKNANFKISEKCFYVDMELNSIAFNCIILY